MKRVCPGIRVGPFLFEGRGGGAFDPLDAVASEEDGGLSDIVAYERDASEGLVRVLHE